MNIVSRAAFAALILMMAGTAAAQEAAPKPAAAPAAQDRWQRTDISFGLSTYSGDANSVQVISQVNSTLQFNRLEWDVIGNVGFNHSDGQRDLHQEEYDGAFRYKLEPSSHWFGMLHTWYEHDEISGVDLRAAAGPGLGVHAIDKDHIRLTLEGGLAATTEKQEVDRDYIAFFFDPSLRWAIGKKITLQQKMNFRYDIEEKDDVRVYWQSDLNFAVTQRVGVGFGVTVDFDNIPVQGHKRMDVETSTHLTIALGRAN